MLDIGWQEIMMISVVTLIVVGPKDLPQVLRTGARLLSKARAMSREFQSGLAEMAREAELDELRRKMEKAAHFDPNQEMRDFVDPTGKLSADFDPSEFTRQLKETVEGGPPTRPAASATVAPLPAAVEPARVPPDPPASMPSGASTSQFSEVPPGVSRAAATDAGATPPATGLPPSAGASPVAAPPTHDPPGR